MKKSIIKRRKRVVPAMQEHVHANQQHPAFGAGGNPAETPYFENEESHNHQIPQAAAQDMNTDTHPHDQYETPPIDFTGYQIDRPRHASTQPQQRPSPPPNSNDHPSFIPQSEPPHNRLSPFQSSAHTRKRSYSNTETDNPATSPPPSENGGRSNRLSSISSILNPTQQQRREDVPIDPSLSLLGQQALRQSLSHPSPQQQQYHQFPPQQQPQQQQQQMGGEGSKPERPSHIDHAEWIAQRKALLRREAEYMREALRAKEREIEELDGEG
ncbi:MAG: hypothetical protein L6R39_004286 [Caloplaca ligustica]|nr:MAG: hypothetical protein L6R39_004286 [Caloplaca ligustica]